MNKYIYLFMGLFIHSFTFSVMQTQIFR